MQLAEIFVRRPVATLLLAVGLFLAGIVAYAQLPVAPLPHVDFPTINVSARLPGADPETIAATVAAPLERRLGQISGVDEMTSTSSTGAANVVLQFNLDRDIEGAARDVQAAINSSGSDLPVDLPNPPTYRKANPADAPILILAVTSNTMTGAKLYDAADIILAQRISQIKGVAQVTLGGADKPAVRVQVDPGALAATGLSMDDVRTTLQQANANLPKGHLDGGKQAMAIDVNDQLRTAADYAPLQLRTNNGNVLRLSQVARVTDSVENARQTGFFNKERAIIIIIQKQADANVIETVDAIKKILPQLEAWMPAGTKISTLIDSTITIRDGLHDVELTLLISIALVIGVVYFSLGRLVPTIAASITVPLSLAGTFLIMWALDYSLDNISLLALIVSVGFVIDDAIVMIENISRHIEAGEDALEAAVKGAGEITFTVISISLSLIAVFIPLLFMGGIIGRLFREFAVTLTAAVFVSLIVSITVTPTVYGHLMKRRQHVKYHTHLGERVFARLQGWYDWGLRHVMQHQIITLIVMLLTIVLTVYLYREIPKGFFPQQDTGMIMATTEARSDISFQAMVPRQLKVMNIILADPAVANIGSSVGAGGFQGSANTGRIFISLKPLKERKASAEEIVNRLRPKLAKVEGLAVFLQAQQTIRVGGRSSKAQFQFALRDEDLKELREWTPRYINALKKTSGITDVSSDQDAASQEVDITVDRDAAARLHVDMAAIDNVLQNAFAQRQVSTIYATRNQYKVVLEVTPQYQQGPAALDNIYVKANDGTQVRLSTLAHYTMGRTPLSINHQGQFPAATLTFNLPTGASLGDATQKITDVARQIKLPSTLHYEFAGNAKAFADSVKSQPMLILMALLTIYIVLGILYENLGHPVTILSTLPSAGIGALLALMVTGNDLSLISIIGVILLMGIVKKNGIILVDFALVAERDDGKTPLEAIMEACDKRFRPILMTTLAAILGALPLIFTGGNGAELRRPLGIAIVGGLIVSQLLTLYTTPVVYLMMEKLRRTSRNRAQSKVMEAT